MKVLILSQYYLPENAQIPSDIANSLFARGHSVKVLTGFPNYPTGKIFPGYKQQWRHKSAENGIEICRVPLFLDHSQRMWARMLNYISFAFSSTTARRFARGADVIYVYATQMTPALGPWLWRMTGGAPYVLHVQDLWPDSITGSSISGGSRKSKFIERLLNPWLARVYRRASSIIGIAPTMVKTLAARGADAEKVHLVFNWSDQVENLSFGTRNDSHPSTTTHVIYAGNIGEMQDLETAVRAAYRAADVSLQLTIIGDGVAKPSLTRLVESLGATNVEFRNPVPREQMASVYAQADFGLVTLKDLPVFRGTVPSKFQSILAHGLPVVTTVQGDVRALTEEHQLGFTADAESVDGLERTFRQAANSPEHERIAMVGRARASSGELFSKEASISRIESILQDAANKGEKRR